MTDLTPELKAQIRRDAEAAMAERPEPEAAARISARYLTNKRHLANCSPPAILALLDESAALSEAYAQCLASLSRGGHPQPRLQRCDLGRELVAVLLC